MAPRSIHRMRSHEVEDTIADPLFQGTLSAWVDFLGFWLGLITGVKLHKHFFQFDGFGTDYSNGIDVWTKTKCRCGETSRR